MKIAFATFVRVQPFLPVFFKTPIGLVCANLNFAEQRPIMVDDDPDAAPRSEKRCEHAIGGKRKGVALLIYDLKHRELIPIKVLTFILFAGIGSLFSFITIHMKSLGITVEETGIINGVSSALSVLAPVLLGLIADKVGNFKMMMSVLTTFLIASSLFFLLIPVGRMLNKFPVNTTLAVECRNEMDGRHSATLVLTHLDSNTCHLKSPNLNQSATNVQGVLEECGYVCYNKNRSSDGSFEEEVLSTAEFRDAVFFPKDWTLNVSCLKTLDGVETCVANTESGDGAGSRNVTLGIVPSVDATRMFSVSSVAMGGDSERKMNNGHCDFNGEGQKLRQKWNYQDQTDNNNTVYQFCLPRCIIRVNRSDMCSNMAGEEVFNPQLTFGLCMFLRTLFDILCGVLDLFVGASVALVNQVGGDYGFQRMFGFIGIAIFSPISGALIDYFSSDTSAQGNIRPAFYLFAALYGIAVIVMLTINLDFKLPAKNPVKDVKSLLRNVELDMLLFAGFISGIAGGYGAFWLFPFLEEIGGTRSLMGLSSTFQSIVSIPLLIFSDRIFRKLSHPNVIAICFGVNVIRLIGYSFLLNPKLCLLFEPMEAIAITLLRTSLITYANQLGTTTTVASIQGLLSAVTFGLGTGVSSYGGSLLIGAYGQRVTFRILGFMSFIIGLIYLLFNFLYLRPKVNQQNDNNNGSVDLKGTIEKSP